MSSTDHRKSSSTENVQTAQWYLLTGLIIGILVGLVISWVLFPLRYVETTPSSLRSDFKDDLRLLIAQAYHIDQNLERAKNRLELLGDADLIQAMTIQTQSLLETGDPSGKAYLLAYLADALKRALLPDSTGTQVISPGTLLPSETPFSLTNQSSPTDSIGLAFTPFLLPELTTTPTMVSPFVLKSIQQNCGVDAIPLLLEFNVLDGNGVPLAGQEIIIIWDSGEDQIFTGLNPAKGNGYANFWMTPGQVYSIQMGLNGVPISGISAPTCSGSSSTQGGLLLIFQQKNN